jgi:hypothetical protein
MKKEIVERLFKAGHITFDEALELMDEKQTIVPQQDKVIIVKQELQPYYEVQPRRWDTTPGQWWQNPITC